MWLFATIAGIGSARQVARLCQEHIAYQWLCGGMNAKTLGDFRIAHCAVLERLLVDSFTAVIQAGVASLERVAQGPRPARRRSALQECRDQAAETVAVCTWRRIAQRAIVAKRRPRIVNVGTLWRWPKRCRPSSRTARAKKLNERPRQRSGDQAAEGAARLDHRRPDHEDGRRWFPSGLQCAVRQ